MGDGTGAVMLDGKMEDDASLKQCLVMVELAEQLAAIDPELKKQYDAIEVELTWTRRSAPAAPSSTCPAPTSGRWRRPSRIPCDGLILDLEDAVAPDAKPAAREAACAAARSGEYGQRELTIRVNGADTEWHADDLAAACAAGPDAIVVPKVNTADAVLELVDAMAGTAPPSTPSCGRWSRRRTPCCTPRRSPRASDRLTVLVMGTNDLAKELYAEHVPGRQPLLAGLGLALLAARADRQGDHRRRLQRREGHRRLPRRVPAGPRDGLRRQDPDPPRPGRGRQRGLRAVGAGRRGRPRHPPGLGGRRRAPASSPTTAG